MTRTYFAVNLLFIKRFDLPDLNVGKDKYYTIDIIVIVRET